MPTVLDIGDRLRNARTRLGLSQQAVALKLGVSQTHVSSMERGAIPTQIDGLINYAVAVHEDPLELLGVVAVALNRPLCDLLNQLRSTTRGQLEATR